MRLLDADALPISAIHGWQFVSKTAIDAFPTVRCADCVYYFGPCGNDTEPCAQCGNPCDGKMLTSVCMNGAPSPYFQFLVLCPTCAKEAS